MQKISLLPLRKLALITGIILFSVQMSRAQAVYLPYSYQLDQKFNADIYSVNSSFHTSLKPFLIDSVISPTYNQIMNRGVDKSRKAWLIRKIFNEHVFDVKTKDYTFYADFLPDFLGGRSFDDHVNTNLNTRGYQAGGTVGDNFFFYTSGYEDQGAFPYYYSDIIDKYDFIPGQAYNRTNDADNVKDWSYVTAILSYTPIKQLNITMGEDKTFIGDGYRSLLLSDFPANYPLLRLTAKLGPVQYMMMWAYLEDLYAPTFDSFGSNRRKYAAFHYLDWNVSKRVSVGFFNAVVVPEADDNGNFHGFDANYVNPIFFSNSLNPKPNAQPDNTLVGFTAKYKILDKTALYGQLLINRFKAGDFFNGNNNADNTNGVQVGIRGADLFGVKNFNYLFEYNAVKPYTYASTQPISSYTDYSEPFGDPLGANFREFIGILNYSIGQFDFMGQLNYAKYGQDTDPATINYGGNVNLPFVAQGATTNIGQGVATNFYYAEGTVSYLINPKYNLRFELGGLVRDQKSDLNDNKTVMITFGLRSTFRQIYHDF